MSEDRDTPVKGILDIDQALKADRKEFRRLLLRKHSLFTGVLFVLISCWYVISSVIFSVPFISPNIDQLLLVGVISVDPNYVTQYWRVFSNIFYHYGLIHFILNTLTLLILGPFIDYMYGRIHLVTIFIFGGLFSNLVSMLILQGSQPIMGTTGSLFALIGSLLMFLPQLEKRTSPSRLQWIWILSFVMCSLGLAIFQLGSNFHMLWFGLLFGIFYGLLGSYFNFHSPIRKSAFVFSIFSIFIASSYLGTQMGAVKQLESVDFKLRKNLEDFQCLR
jgi:membrane associated rhomboid family serine protease